MTVALEVAASGQEREYHLLAQKAEGLCRSSGRCKLLRRLRIAVVFAVLGCLAGGCGRAAKRQAVRVLVGWDTSGSNRSRLPEDTRLGMRLIRRLDPDRDTIKLYRVDHQVDVFYDQRPPASREALQQLLVQELQPRARKRMTRPVSFWRQALADIGKSRQPSVIVLLTDGENDDQSPRARGELRAVAKELARSEHLQRVCIWGVKNASRGPLQRDFAVLGDRLSIHGFTDVLIDEACPTFDLDQPSSANPSR